jgi:hypothetical protein
MRMKNGEIVVCNGEEMSDISTNTVSHAARPAINTVAALPF